MGGLLAVGAAGCGFGASGSNEEGSKPRKIQHKHGVTEIEGIPSRIVTVGLTEQDYVLALGSAPVAVREWFGDHPGALWPWARQALGDRPLPEVLPVDGLDFERIVGFEPDLVIGVNSGLTAQEYDTLAKIAPTVAQPEDYADYGAPWQEITRVIGQAMGREQQAEDLVRRLEQRFDRTRAENPGFADSTALLAASMGGEAYAYAEGPAPKFLTQLGLELPPAAAGLFTGENRAPVQVSLERLKVLEADALLLGVYDTAGRGVADKRVYQELDTVKQGRDLVMPQMSRVNGALSFGSVLSLPIALDEVVPRLAAMVDGDRRTEPEPAG
ncbi:iron-siderophore ABC transporter substrate-binding protein [Parasphingorhabdus pacifica]